MAHETDASRWLRQAREDLLTATRLLDLERFYAACFFAQQAAEKAAKAVLYHRGAEMVRGHSVADLWREVARDEPSLTALQATASHLDTYYIPTRYPDALPGGVPAEAYDEASAGRAVESAALILECAARLVS